MKQGEGRKLLFLLLFLMVCLAGCSGKEEEQAEYNIYYINKEKTKIVPVPYEPMAENDDGLINELILKLSQSPESMEFQKPMGSGVELISWGLDNHQLNLKFDSDYSNMDNVEEVLCRAALVRTLIQVESVDYINFTIGDAPLMDSKGNPMGLMTAESFIENPGEQINTIQSATITLYFSNRQGDGLVQEIRENVPYNSNISLEKLVMEQLLKGPKTKDAISALPQGTKLVSVSVLDGVCFVNLDEGFMKQNYEISESVVIYSIVNSLVELSNVNKVQISVNGDTSITYREKYSLGNVYDRNLDLLEGIKEKETTPKDVEEMEIQVLEEAEPDE